MNNRITFDVENLLCKKEVVLSKDEINKIVLFAIKNKIVDVTYYGGSIVDNPESSAHEDIETLIDGDECTIYLKDMARIIVAPHEED